MLFAVFLIIWPAFLNACEHVRVSNYTAGYNGALRLNQISVLGSHNSGAYTESSFFPFISDCFVRSQEISWLKQLEKGVRYFDVDACYKEGSLKFCHGEEPWDIWRSHFFDPVSTGFYDLKCFLTQNPNEIVFLHLNRDSHVFGSSIMKRVAVRMLFSKMEVFEDHIFPLKEYMQTHQRLPTLQEARRMNKTVFIIIADKFANLMRNVPSSKRKWPIRESRYMNIMWLNLPVELEGLKVKVKSLKEHKVSIGCSGTRSFIDLQVVPEISATSGCSDSVAKAFKRENVVGKTFDRCFERRCRNGLGVNFVTVDHVQTVPDATVKKIYESRCA